jgi:hypothetical protein
VLCFTGSNVMNWEAFGAIAEALGAAGVIATLVYLASQIRQNSLMMKAQIRDSIADKQISYFQAPLLNEPLLETYRKVFLDEEIEHGPDRFRLVLYVQSLFREWENAHYQNKIGLYDDDEFQARTNVWKNVMTQKAFQEVWLQNSENYSPDFRNIMDSYVGLGEGSDT